MERDVPRVARSTNCSTFSTGYYVNDILIFVLTIRNKRMETVQFIGKCLHTERNSKVEASKKK